ncbi:hypothetical protein FJT64_000924 [Amphibalanus amphitrite]|uniref:Uncharacterized protein n=1 Tax=Amphibalanus amphitrite TaxID=1232801 RepID=A0A6A4VAM2_AMPAM|nr:hypothetical protein FJT64_000924 [Amphibalanus amphitrite]
MAGPLAGTPGDRRPRAVPLVRSLLRWTARAAGLLVLLTLAGQQLLEFRAQPVSSTVVRKKAPFPRLTVCPAASLTDYSLLLERQQQLVNDSISLLDYYNLTTPEMVGVYPGLMLFADHLALIPKESDLGLANVNRRPCRSEPGYSLTQCLKECLWRRLAAHIGCRLPHMVAADAYLPEIRGPVDHLPMCKRPVQKYTGSTLSIQ